MVSSTLILFGGIGLETMLYYWIWLPYVYKRTRVRRKWPKCETSRAYILDQQLTQIQVFDYGTQISKQLRARIPFTLLSCYHILYTGYHKWLRAAECHLMVIQRKTFIVVVSSCSPLWNVEALPNNNFRPLWKNHILTQDILVWSFSPCLTPSIQLICFTDFCFILFYNITLLYISSLYLKCFEILRQVYYANTVD